MIKPSLSKGSKFIRKSNAIRNATKESWKPSLVLFSDLLALRPKVPYGAMFRDCAIKYGIGIDPKQIGNTWHKIYHRPSNFFEMFNPKLYEQLENGFDPKRHYDKKMEQLITENISLYSHSQSSSDITPAQFRALCRWIFIKFTNPFSYYIPPEFKQIARVLNINNIRWGIVSNHGPYFEGILDELNGRLDHPIYNTYQPVVVLDAIDDGYAKPHPNIFRRALKTVPYNRREDIYMVGISPTYDLPWVDDLPLKTILLTETMDTPVSDLDTKPADQVRAQKNSRLKKLSDLANFFSLAETWSDVMVNTMQTTAEQYTSSSGEVVSFMPVGDGLYRKESSTNHISEKPEEEKEEKEVNEDAKHEAKLNSKDFYNMMLPEALIQDKEIQENYLLLEDPSDKR